MKEIRHGNENRYFLFFKFNSRLNEIVRQIAGCKYSNSYRAWHLPAVKSNLSLLYSAFKNTAWVDTRSVSATSLVIGITHEAAMKDKIETTIIPRPVLPLLNPNVLPQVEDFKKWMRSRRYSESTISTYVDGINVFLKYFHHKSPDEIDNKDIIDFNNDYILKYNCSASYQNQIINAVKLFFRICGSQKLNPELIYRPKRPKLLPNVLSKEEVKMILNASQNIKHRVMLSLIYACGLRCGELLRLKPEHVDSKRGLLIIKQAKGRKDRITPLGAKTIELLREYAATCKPLHYLFEGQTRGEMYDARSLQQVLKNSVIKAGVEKPVTLHWLRHSYATHLLENGTDLRYIQEILGHSSSRTTEIYTHVSTRNIQQITSPFDYL